MKQLTRELLAQIDTLQIPSGRRTRLNRRGERTSQKKGASLEFSDYREYLQGDDIRSIDWNVYARTEKLFLKLFFEDESRPVYFIVDASRSMGFGDPSKFDYALSLASALSYISLKRYDRPRLLVVKDRAFRSFSFASQKHFFAVTAQLEKQAPEGETHLNAALRKIAFARYPRGIYFLISDFYSSDGFNAMSLLTATGNELHCLHLLPEEEIHPDLRGDLRLIDSENDGRTEVSISPQVLRRYLARLAALQRETSAAARKSLAKYYFISTSVPLASLILRDLKRQGMVS
ncbi:MAG TPA: DUF58 domain-containing protein [Acidobacteriota bacterium]|nr:DUF58 domain-containing protein [Acidobacteriota bacterium]